MRLDVTTCWDRIGLSGNATLSTIHPARGVDAVPVVFVVAGREIVLPVDTVKPKSGHRLQRLANIEADPRVVLLVDGYADDWSQLWWVRVHAEAAISTPTDAQRAALATAFPAYGPPGAVTEAILLTPTEVTGWSAS